MIRILLTLTLALLAGSLQAATVCVRNPGSGSQSGADWNNAVDHLPTPLVRGNTYIVASGAYNGRTIDAAVSGTTQITIQKATPASHGPDTGWSNAFSAGQAVISGSPVLTFNTSYITITDDTIGGYGMLLNVTDAFPNSGAFTVFNGSTVNNVTLHHIETVGTGPQTTTQSTRAFYLHATGMSNWQIDNCYFHDNLEWVHTLDVNNFVFEYNHFKNCGSFTAQHNEGFGLSGNGITIRYNVIENCLGPSNTTYIEPQQNPTQNVWIYGNVFLSTSAQESTTQYSALSTASASTITGGFFNNTIYGFRGINPGIQAAGSGFLVQNNVWQNCANTPTFAGNVTADHNVLNTPFAISFVDPVNGNFHLASQTPQLGVTLASPYATDPDGVPRVPGNWSLGAFQYAGAGVPGTVSFSQATAAVTETGGTLTVTVNRTLGSSGAVSITASTSDGTAIAGHDYTATSITLNWADGAVGARSFTVPIINSGDTASTNRTFTITLGTPGGGVSVGSPSTQTVTIIMTRPAGTVQWSATGYSTTESSGSVTLTATRTGGSGGILVANYATSNGSAVAGHDYTSTSGQFTWADGDAANKTVAVPIINSGDTSTTPRTFVVSLSGTGVGMPSSALVTIAMNPPLPIGSIQWSAAIYNTTEASPSVTLTAQRFGGSSGVVSVNFNTANGSAVAGHDYTATSGTLTWASGDAGSQSVTVPLINSGDTSTTPRTFQVNLSAPTGGAGLGLSSALVSIAMTSPGPPVIPGKVGFTQTAYSTTETNGTVTISVSRSAGTNAPVSVSVVTSNGSAAAGFDYTATTGTLSWSADENSTKSFNVPILNSGSFGPPRFFTVTIISSSGGPLITPAQTAVSITMLVPVGITTQVTIGKTIIGASTTIGGK